MMDEIIKYDNGEAIVSNDFAEAFVKFEAKIKALKEEEEALKKQIALEMEEKGIIKAETDLISISYIAPSKYERLDSAKLKKEKPEIYDSYTKLVDRKGYVKVTVK